MGQKLSNIHVSIFVLLTTTLLLAFGAVRLVNAGRGIVLRPPFAGTYRVTSYFDHDKPTYCTEANGVIKIYNGEAVSANCSTHLGEPYPYDGHDGWDFSMDTGTDVLAAASGQVVFRGIRYGNTLVIKHNNDYYTQYSHLDSYLVLNGEFVVAGQHIAESGSSGTTAAHLHFTVSHGSYNNTIYAIDPFGWRGTQRDPLFDYNGKESACLWAGGPGASISCADFIVEDDGAGWSQYPSSDNSCGDSVSSWAKCDHGNGFRYHWAYVANPANFWAKWTPTLPYPGYYQIQVFIPAENATTTYAIYELHRLSGTTFVPVYENYGSDTWISLGTFYLQSPTEYVQLYDYTGEPSRSKRIAADAVKYSASIVHLPHVRNNPSGWVSSLIVRNNSASDIQVIVNYYNTSGGLVTFTTHVIAGNATKTLTPSTGFDGSAVVVADQDVAVEVVDQSSIATTSYVGNQSPATSAYLPNLIVTTTRQAYVSLQNAGASAATVSLNFYNRNGGLAHSRTETIPVNGDTTLLLNNIPQIVSGFASTSSTGSLFASVTNGVPIAVSAQINYTDQNGAYAYGGVSSGDTTLWTPGVFRRVSGSTWLLYSAVNVQNLSASSTTIHVQFINRSGAVTYQFDDTVPARSTVAYNTRYQGTTPSWIWNPLIAALGNDWAGSVHVTNNAGISLAGVYLYFPAQYGADMIAVPLTGQGQSTTGSLIAPAVYRQQSGSTWTHWSTVLVQNTTDSAASITVRVFNSVGVQQGSDCTLSVPLLSYAALNLKTGVDLPPSCNLLNTLGTNFAGSMTVTSNDGRAVLAIYYDFFESTGRISGDAATARP